MGPLVTAAHRDKVAGYLPAATEAGARVVLDGRDQSFDGDGFFGDSLFRLSVGRTDLGGDARVYARTLQSVILGLPDETIVRSGHGPDTTIGVERRENPFLNGAYRLV